MVKAWSTLMQMYTEMLPQEVAGECPISNVTATEKADLKEAGDMLNLDPSAPEEAEVTNKCEDIISTTRSISMVSKPFVFEVFVFK